MSTCHECRFFSDLGRCRNGAARRSDVGFFQKACDKFLPPPQEANQEPTKQPQTMEKETKIAPAETEAPKKKTCRECGRELPLDQFSKNRNGSLHVCKDCMKAKRAKAAEKGQQIGRYKTPVRRPSETFVSLLTPLSDTVIIEELKKRGYTGTLSKTITCEL